MASGAIDERYTRQRLWETELDRVNRAQRIVTKTNRSLHQFDDVVSWLNQVCQSAVDLGGYRMAYVGFAEMDKHRMVRTVACAGFETRFLQAAAITCADQPHGRGTAGTAIHTGHTSIARNIPQDPAFDPWRKEIERRGYQSSIGLPLICDGRTFGVLALYAKVIDAFGPKEVEVLEELADDLAFGITVVLRTRAQRRAANEALKESQSKLQEAERIAHLGNWERDLKTNVVKGSEEFFRIFGMPAQTRQSSYSQFLKRVHADDRPRVACVPDRLRVKAAHFDLAYRIVLPNGQVRFIHNKGHVNRDKAGQPVRVFGIVQDMTQEHRAQEALQNANRSLAAKNIALQEVLANIKAEQSRIGRQVAKNVRKLVLPLIHSLGQGLNRRQTPLEQIEQSLEEIASPFIDKISQAVAGLTPTELRISNFVRRGLAVKEIAELEHLSPQTIAAHRRNIRRKLGISNRKINLSSHLRSIFPEESGGQP